MESITIVCGGCQARIGKAERTRIRWSRGPHRAPSDLCPDCRDKILERRGTPPPPLFPDDDQAEAMHSTPPTA